MWRDAGENLHIRRRMFKSNECGVQQGSINVHGKPQKPSRPGFDYA